MKPLGMMVMLALLSIPSRAGAQQSLEVGDRVRVYVRDERTHVVGWVEEMGRDSLTLTVDYVWGPRRGLSRAVLAEGEGTPLSLGLDEVSEVQRSVGAHRNTGRFAVAAGLIGGAIGAFAASTCNECYPEWWSLGAVVVGVPSLFLGGIVGTFVVTEDWKDVSGTWSERAAAMLPSAVLPAPDGGLTVSWTIGVP